MHFEIYRDARQEWRWTLYAANGLKVADSGEGYHNRADCMHGIALVQSAGTAPIKERHMLSMPFSLHPKLK